MYADMTGFCHAFKDWEGQPTNVLIQMDVDEFLNMFIDWIEEKLKPTIHKRLIKNLFGGKFINQTLF